MIYKNKGIKYGEYILNDLSYYLDESQQLRISVETFYNCREQGYLLNVYNEFNLLSQIWVYAQRNSDEPTITYNNSGKYSIESGNRFDEDSWLNRTKSFDNIDKASKYVLDLIEGRK